MSRSKTVTLATVSIIVVVLLVATIYFVVPNEIPSRIYTIAAFALGTQAEIQAHAQALSGSTTAIFVQGMWLKIKFSNGSMENISSFGYDIPNTPPNFSAPECAGALYSSDIIEIHLDRTGFLEIGDNSPIMKQFLRMNSSVYSNLLGEREVDLGVLNVIDEKAAGRSSTGPIAREYLTENPIEWWSKIPWNPQWKNTGYWNDYRGFEPNWPPAWQINSTQIQNLLLNSSYSATVNFKMDLNIEIQYQSLTENGNVTSTQTGTTQWSGTWGTLQLLHEDDKLIGLTYDFTNIGLNAILT